MNISCVLSALLAMIRLAESALLCDRSKEPAFYWLDEPSHCDDTSGTPAVLNVTTDHVKTYRVKGWVVVLQEFICTTHYFVWGSYSVTHNLIPVKINPVDSPDPGCPDGHFQYNNPQDLLSLCEWAWPSSVTTSKKVCRRSMGMMENSPGGYFIEGAKASCKDYTCWTDSGVLFVHTSALHQLEERSQTSKLITDALCTSSYCIDPSSMTLYKVQETAIPGEGWDSGFISITGEMVRLRWIPPKTNPKPRRTQRDTSEDIQKIMYLEEETLRLSRDTRILCHIISQIKTLFWMSSSSAPTTLASYWTRTT
ncbi:unnamed protein product [Parnassius apollo]|uniref:(apollo) hypothetical protein n=1 Tax=Parnassius apollo TaxID=110799 RepID=A0A8S3YCL8_PARAO|nr:unnamed protein product [Parnassius apollo]